MLRRTATPEQTPTPSESASNGAISWIDVENPATGGRAGRVAATAAADVPGIVARAREAQERWAATSMRHRRALMTRFHDIVLDRADDVLDTIQAESGKARRDAITELLTVAGTARHYLVHGPGYIREHSVRAAIPGLTGARVTYKPHGVVGLITPWNYPFLLGIADALPALLAGNAVVTKPAELTPLSAALAIELLVEAGFDPDLVIAVHGKGSVVGPALIDHVDYVGFTGSTETGRTVAKQASQRLIPYSLELGGKNPMLVLDGAPIDDAVTGLLNGAFCNTGQTCISIERVYVQDTIWDEFVERARQRTEELAVGWSTGWDIDMGSLVSTDHAAKVQSHIDDAVAKGATVLTGGTARSDLGPAFLTPTLLTDVDDSMLVAREETFGPVAVLHKVASAEEAVRLANDSPYGLNASVWGKGRGRQPRAIARELNVGSAGINSTLLIYNSFHAPMGGVGDSGIGRRHGPEGIRRYTVEQSIVSSVATAGGYESIARHMTTNRRAQLLIGLFKAWRRIPGLR